MNDIIPYHVYYSRFKPVSRLAYAEEDILQLNQDKSWFLGAVFYAIRPDFYPIPRGMSLVTTENKDYFPYSSSYMAIVLDPFHLHYGTTNFITYYTPVNHTIPMYIYKIGDDDLFIAFGKENKGFNNEQILISPLYVMWGMYTVFRKRDLLENDLSTGPMSILDFKENFIRGSNFIYDRFECLEERCVPSLTSSSGLKECLTSCLSIENQRSYYEDEVDPRLHSISNINVGEGNQDFGLNQNNKIIYISSMGSGICILIFLLLVYVIHTRV